MEEGTQDFVVFFYHWFLFPFQQVKESRMQDLWEDLTEVTDASHLALCLCLEKNTLLHLLLLDLQPVLSCIEKQQYYNATKL